MKGRLTQQIVDDASTDKPRLELYDGRGLMLMVLASGKRTWFVRKTAKGKTRQRKVGDAATMTLEEARRAAPHAFDEPDEPPRDEALHAEVDALRREVAEQSAAIRNMRGDIQRLLGALHGRDVSKIIRDEDEGRPFELPSPIPELSRDALPAEDSDPDSDTNVAAFVARYLELKQPAGDWQSAARAHIVPKVGDREASALTPCECAKAVNSIDSPVVRQRARRVLRDALSVALADGLLSSNPAGEALDPLLRKNGHTTKHYEAVPYSDAPALYASLGDDIGSLCVRLQMLCAVRPSEARKAKWAEIDFESETWTISPERMKMKAAHVVPLSRAALDVLALCERDGDCVFPGIRGGPVNRTVVDKALKKHAPDATLHGLRSTFRDWAEEQTGCRLRRQGESARTRRRQRCRACVRDEAICSTSVVF